MNTNMTGFKRFSKILRDCAFYESSVSIERVKTQPQVYDPCITYCLLRKTLWNSSVGELDRTRISFPGSPIASLKAS